MESRRRIAQDSLSDMSTILGRTTLTPASGPEMSRKVVCGTLAGKKAATLAKRKNASSKDGTGPTAARRRRFLAKVAV